MRFLNVSVAPFLIGAPQAAPETHGLCQRGLTAVSGAVEETHGSCVPMLDLTHVYDVAAKWWLLPFICTVATGVAKARICELIRKMRKEDLRERLTFSRAILWLDASQQDHDRSGRYPDIATARPPPPPRGASLPLRLQAAQRRTPMSDEMPTLPVTGPHQLINSRRPPPPPRHAGSAMHSMEPPRFINKSCGSWPFSVCEPTCSLGSQRLDAHVGTRAFGWDRTAAWAAASSAWRMARVGALQTWLQTSGPHRSVQPPSELQWRVRDGADVSPQSLWRLIGHGSCKRAYTAKLRSTDEAVIIKFVGGGCQVAVARWQNSLLPHTERSSRSFSHLACAY